MSGPRIGRSLPRREDFRLLTGQGRFADDRDAPGQARLAFVRSPHAHAAILAIDTASARRMPGVAAVFTAGDLAQDGVRPIPTLIRERGAGFRNRDGSAMADPPYFPLARDVVRHVGDPVAVVIAETEAGALDAAEAIVVDYRPRDALIGTARAGDAASPRVWDIAPGNRCFDWRAGDAAATAAAFATADHVVRLVVVNNRIVTSFMEPRAVLAAPDPATGGVVVHNGNQGVHAQAAVLAAALDLPVAAVRVVSEDVGGGFGSRIFAYPEYVVAAWAARRLGRPVKWCASRSEAFLTDLQGRDHVTAGALALDRDGRIRALAVRSVCNFGAYVSTGAPFSAYQNLTRMISAAYAIPAIDLELTGVFSHTTPVNVYRGVGRAEAIYIVERLIDRAAHALRIDRARLRHINLVRASAMPYRTPTGAVYDTGDYAANQESALRLADWDGFAARRAEAERRGLLRGIAVVHALEGTGGVPTEFAEARVEPDGRVVVAVGSQSHGQGHETTFAQVVADVLGIDVEAVAIVSSDTARVAAGVGTFASRSMIKGGSAAWQAGERVIEKGRRLAAELLEADHGDIIYRDGAFTVSGTDRSIGLFALARALEAGAIAGETALAASHVYDNADYAFAAGCHVCEVEVDPETGGIAIAGYAMVDDVGRMVNPMIVAGQAHGAVAQGLGQALLEHAHYDAASGQPLSGSFMDYALPRADDIPSFRAGHRESPTPTNPLGVKGAGEGGTVGAPPALVNAVLDALAPLGVSHLDMPLTPETVWRAICAAS
ncbi:MAG: xanthine dehydrogenase family protein molybdopterin-binding subunit [Alphaproteobacteria bacterium]|nr:xanthine dehydrogenase family protein molybdopterin-binding subunit [Alphaproteobacteria bacterium]